MAEEQLVDSAEVISDSPPSIEKWGEATSRDMAEEQLVDSAEAISDSPPSIEKWGEDISPEKNKLLFKTIVTPGNGPEEPMAGDEVLVHYTGRLLNGEVFDSSVERDEKFKFKLGQGQVIKGWDAGVATMKRGEKCLLTCMPEFAYGESGSPPKIGPNETLQFEVELFDWKGEDVTGDGGVVKSILLTSGENYSSPEDGSVVDVHLRGTYEGSVFFEDDVNFEFGEGSVKGVINGVEQAIGKMKLKEKARVTVKAEYGYGNEGNRELDIPGGATLTYEIRLNNFTKVKEAWEYGTLEERLEDASHLKDRGGKYFKEGRFDMAKRLYKRGADLLTDTSIRKEEVKEQARPMRVALHLNLAACHLKLKEDMDAIKECKEVIDDDAENVKAHFRCGQAYASMQEYDDAVVFFSKVKQLEPENKAAQRELKNARNKIKALKERQKKLYASMFASDTKENQPEETKANEPTEAVEMES